MIGLEDFIMTQQVDIKFRQSMSDISFSRWQTGADAEEGDGAGGECEGGGQAGGDCHHS